MSPTRLFMEHPDYSVLMKNLPSTAQRMSLVKTLRTHATLILGDAVRRIPPEKPSIIEAYKAKGLDPIWVLTDNDDAIRFCLTLPKFEHTSNELEAARLLRACVAAEEVGDVPEFRNMLTGEKFIVGRKPNTGGPIRKKIATLLKKNPAMKNPQLWESVIKKLPRKWSLIDGKKGLWLDGPTTDDHMTQGRFFTVCGEERKKTG